MCIRTWQIKKIDFKFNIQILLELVHLGTSYFTAHSKLYALSKSGNTQLEVHKSNKRHTVNYGQRQEIPKLTKFIIQPARQLQTL